MELFFATGNKGKFASAKRIMEGEGIILKQVELDIKEPRSDTIEEISINKAKQAFEILKKPVMVEDSGFIIESLGNFPGPYINFVLKTIGINGILKLVGENRDCFFRSVVTYYDGKTLKTFHLDEHGKIAKTPSKKQKGAAWSELWKIFIPEGYEKTLNDLEEEEFKKKQEEYKKNSGFHQLARWILSRNSE